MIGLIVRCLKGLYESYVYDLLVESVEHVNGGASTRYDLCIDGKNAGYLTVKAKTVNYSISAGKFSGKGLLDRNSTVAKKSNEYVILYFKGEKEIVCIFNDGHLAEQLYNELAVKEKNYLWFNKRTSRS